MGNNTSTNYLKTKNINMKTIIAMLVLGTSVLAFNAQAGSATTETGSTTADLRWNHYQSASANPKVGTYSPVPEARTIIAGALLLLPLGVSAVRGFRRNTKPVNQNG
jgi:hypothetical protein